MPLHEGNIAVIEDKSIDTCNLTEADIKDDDVPLLCQYLAKNPHKKRLSWIEPTFVTLQLNWLNFL